MVRRNHLLSVTPDIDNGPGHWTDRAACRGTEDPEIFFGPPKATDSTATTQALALCDGCPVTTRCLDEAVTAAIERGGPGHAHGIAGGLTEDQLRDRVRHLQRADALQR